MIVGQGATYQNGAVCHPYRFTSWSEAPMSRFRKPIDTSLRKELELDSYFLEGEEWKESNSGLFQNVVMHLCT